jgi:hypothetical protein
VIHEGASFYQEFTWEVGNPSVPVDLTGMTGRLQARDAIEDADPVFDLSTGTGGIIILSPPTLGGYAISIPASTTKGKCRTHERRILVYDLFLFSDGGNSAGLQQKGRITINPAVTRIP